MPQGHWAFPTAQEGQNHEAHTLKPHHGGWQPAPCVSTHSHGWRTSPSGSPFSSAAICTARVWSLDLRILMLSLPPTHSDFTPAPTHAGQRHSSPMSHTTSVLPKSLAWHSTAWFLPLVTQWALPEDPATAERGAHSAKEETRLACSQHPQLPCLSADSVTFPGWSSLPLP